MKVRFFDRDALIDTCMGGEVKIDNLVHIIYDTLLFDGDHSYLQISRDVFSGVENQMWVKCHLNL
jgi:hypothetical protein